jgi:hypothetical protein
MSDKNSNAVTYPILRDSAMGKYIENKVLDMTVPHPYIRDVKVIKAKIKKETVYPTMIDIETFGDEAMPVTFYSCKLKLKINGIKCKFKGNMLNSEKEAVDRALRALKERYLNKEEVK